MKIQTPDNSGIVFTRDLTLCSILQYLGFRLDPDLPAIKDENGIATFFFLPDDGNGNSSAEALQHYFDAKWRAENPDHIITRIHDVFSIREATLDHIHSLSPMVQIKKGKYTIVVSPDASEQVISEIEEFYGKGVGR